MTCNDLNNQNMHAHYSRVSAKLSKGGGISPLKRKRQTIKLVPFTSKNHYKWSFNLCRLIYKH